MVCCDFECKHIKKDGCCDNKPIHNFCTWRSCVKDSQCEECRKQNECAKRLTGV